MNNAFSPSAITLTIDLEDASLRYAPGGRYDAQTRHILDLCEAGGHKATFFIVGRLAEAAPQLVRDIAARGHEIAYHSHNHVSLLKEEPARFKAESRADKDHLEQLAGKSVVGFRAPCFSLTPKSAWALDILAEAGFHYSSSVMPTALSLNGFPDAPRTAFRWPSGLIEFPLPVVSFGKYKAPYLGGIYLYTMPFFLVRRCLMKAQAGEVLWTYAHPYDFETDKTFISLAQTPLWISLVLWWGRLSAEKKIKTLLSVKAAKPLGERLDEARTSYRISQGKPSFIHS